MPQDPATRFVESMRQSQSAADKRIDKSISRVPFVPPTPVKSPRGNDPEDTLTQSRLINQGLTSGEITPQHAAELYSKLFARHGVTAKFGGNMAQQAQQDVYKNLFTGGSNTVTGVTSLIEGANTSPPGSTGSSPEMGAQAADNLSSLIRELTSPIPEDIIRRGLTPVPTGTATQLPPSLSRPVQPWQNIPLDKERVVGAGNARARGIGNAITGLTNFVGNLVQANAQREQDKLSVTTQRLLQAQQAIDQAKLGLGTARGTQKDALQATIAEQEKVMDTILSDPKTRKSIEKGLNISFTDPTKNNTNDHRGVQAGIDKVQQSYAAQFASQMPKTMGPDPMAQYRMNFAMQMKAADQKLLTTLIPRIMASQDSMERFKLGELGRNMRFLSNQQSQWSMLNARFNESERLQGIKHDDRMGEIAFMFQESVDKLNQMLYNRQTDPMVIQQHINALTQNYAKAESVLTSRYQAARAREEQYRAMQATAQAQGNNDAANLMGQNISMAQQDEQMLQQMLSNLQETKQKDFAAWGAYAGAAARARENQQKQGGVFPNAPTPNVVGPNSQTSPPISGVGGPSLPGLTPNAGTISPNFSFSPGSVFPTVSFYGEDESESTGSEFTDEPDYSEGDEGTWPR